jgi:hypothetical protein
MDKKTMPSFWTIFWTDMEYQTCTLLYKLIEISFKIYIWIQK